MFIKPARARVLANFTPIQHWEGGELKSGRKCYFLGKWTSLHFCMTLEQNTYWGVQGQSPNEKKFRWVIFGRAEFWDPTGWLKLQKGQKGPMKKKLFLHRAKLAIFSKISPDKVELHFGFL